VALIGLTLCLGRAGRQVTDFQVFPGEPFDLRGAPAVAASPSPAAPGGHQHGVVILIATPIARVLLSLVACALQRDRTYVAATLIVVGVLLSGLFGVGP
jgi:hypothetical protein